jgi:hypothetical protein
VACAAAAALAVKYFSTPAGGGLSSGLKIVAKAAGAATVITSVLFVLITANLAQLARDVILRGFPREVVFTEPGIYDRTRFDAYILQAGDYSTTVVVDSTLNSPADSLEGDKVVSIRNNSILDRQICVPDRKGGLSVAALISRYRDPLKDRTSTCSTVLKPAPQPKPE